MSEGGSVDAPASVEASGSTDNIQAEVNTDSAPDQTQAAAPAQSDDPEFDLAGEKLKLSEYKRLREIEAKRKEMDRGANEKFQEAAKLRKQAEADRAAAQELVGSLTKDAKAALRAAGIDPIRWAEQTLAEALEEHQLTPEQKRLRELEAREKQREAEEAERKANETQAQEAQAIDYYTNELSGAFITALQALKLPEDDLPEAVARMSHRLEALLDSGAPIDIDAIAADVADRLYAAPAYRLQSLSDEQLQAQYPDLIERARKIILKQTQPKQPAPQTPAASTVAKARKPLTIAELRARVDKRIGA